MSLGKIVSAADAVALIRDGDVLAIAGYAGSGVAESMLAALQERFRATGEPRDLTLLHATGIGDGLERGLNRLAERGLLRRVITSFYGLAPRLGELAVAGEIEAYAWPQGVIVDLYRAIGAGKPGVISRIGLGTFVDPRYGGGKVNARTVEDLVALVDVDGADALLFRSVPIRVAFIRGTTADPDGNVTLEREALTLEHLALAIAAHNSGGYVICQVERIAQSGSLTARQIAIPGILVDSVVVAGPDDHLQTYGTRYNPAFSGEIRVPPESVAALPLDERKVIARRAASELRAGSIVNLGIGMPDNVGAVAHEEKIADLIVLTVDPGVIGGVPMSGRDFGVAVNAQAVLDHATMFDFIGGGGLDVAFLGMAECDGRGNVNVSRFGDRLTGPGGFIDISHRAKAVVFVGTFTSGGLQVALDEGRVRILREGRNRKFVAAVQQVTFSGAVAAEDDRDVLYVTERCVFRLGPGGLELVEVAPGIDVDRDVLSLLPFTPVATRVTVMDPALFRHAPIGLRSRLLDIGIEDRIAYSAETNTLFLNYAGMHVRTTDDVHRIKDAVDAVLAPLGGRVNAIVNYDRFVADPAIMDAYADLVKYVEDRYYLQVSRYSTSGFLRLKLGAELGRRRLSGHVFETRREARRNLAT